MFSLGQNLIVVGGKGGVGRSSTAAGLAVALAQRDKKVLVVDPIASGGLLQALGQAPRSVVPGETTRVVAEGIELSLLEMSTESSLQEYIDRFVPLPVGSSRLMSLGPIARMFDYVSNAAPAVKEILTIGKIGHEVRYGDWDTVIVDAPATGHVVELLSAPDSLSELVKVGPLIEQTSWLSEILADPLQTSVVLVATPEELPVSELTELYTRIKNETSCAVTGFVINRVPTVLSPSGIAEADALTMTNSSLAPAAQIVMQRSKTTVRQIERVADLGLPHLEVEDSSEPSRVFSGAFDDVILDGGQPNDA